MAGTHEPLDPQTLDEKLEKLRIRAVRAPEEVLRALEALRPDLVEETESDALATWCEGRAQARRGEVQAALDAASRLARLGVALGRPRLVVGSRMLVAQALTVLGHLAPALAEYEDVIASVDIDADLHREARLSRAGLLRADGQLEAAAAAFDELVDHSEGVDPDLHATLLINAASCWRRVERVEDAWAALQEAKRLLPRVADTDIVAWWHAIVAWLEVGERAEVHAREALRRAAPFDLPLRSSAARAYARVAMRSGGASFEAAARSALEGVLEAARERGHLAVCHEVLRDLADLADRQGDMVVAVRCLRELEDVGARLRRDTSRLRAGNREVRLELLKERVTLEGLRARAEALALQNRSLAEMDGQRQRLLQGVAHDLRGPLTTILGCAELMDPGDPARAAELRAEILLAADRMASMIDRALSPDSIRAGSSSLVRVPGDLYPTLEATVRSFQPLARRSGRRLQMFASSPLVATCDPVAFVRIVDNLVGNALKHGSGGKVTVRAEPLPNGLRLCVDDDGEGFPTEDPDGALLLGEQLGADPSQGRGLGLHTVYQLVTRMGGVVTAENRPEGGARVVVRLPRGR